MNEDIDNFLTGQLAHWPTAQHNYAALSRVRVKTLDVDGTAFRVQCNPARIVSSAARVDERSIRQRACFLCAANRPAEQEAIRALEGRYDILVNPFPIFPRHLTLAATDHVSQRIAPRLADLLRLARMLPGYTLFYNGPRCGASAPDHAHFQAGSRGFLPIETQWTSLPAERLGGCGHSSLYGLNGPAPSAGHRYCRRGGSRRPVSHGLPSPARAARPRRTDAEPPLLVRHAALGARPLSPPSSPPLVL